MHKNIVILFFSLVFLCAQRICAQEVDIQAVSESTSQKADIVLLKAAEVGNFALLRKLATSANINSKDANGNSLLHLALLNDHPECARFLIQAGANVKTVNIDGQTPLHIVNDPGIAYLLIKKGADVNARNNEYLMSPIFYANTRVLKILLKNGADANLRARKNMTALMWQAYGDQLANMKLLVKYGIRINEVNDEANTVLDIAERFSLKGTINYLRAAGAKKRIELAQ